MTKEELHDILTRIMAELVPNEEYSIAIYEVGNGEYKLELTTESKRATVAWAEITFVLDDLIGSGDDNIRGLTGDP